MSKGHPYRYEHGPGDRTRGRFGPHHDGRRGSYKRQRISNSGNDFTTFSLDDFGQEAGLGNFTDFSAVSSDTVLQPYRDSKRHEKPWPVFSKMTTTTAPISVQPPSSTITKFTSSTSPLAITISPTTPPPPPPPSTTDKPPPITTQKSNSLLSSFHRTEHTSPQQSPQFIQRPPLYSKAFALSTKASHVPPASQVEPPTVSVPQSVHYSALSDHTTAQSTGLLMQVSPIKTPPSYIKTTPVTPTKDEVYQPKVEAVSPSNSENEVEKSSDETPKEELLKHMEKVDKEIAEVEMKISDLREKKKLLEDDLLQDVIEVVDVDKNDSIGDEDVAKEEEDEKEVNRQMEKEQKEEVEKPPPVVPPRQKMLIERIYAENRMKAAAAHEQFAKLGIPLPNALPLYNQPSDLPFYEENRRTGRAVQLKLVKYFQRKRREKQLKQRALLEEYRVLEKKWLEKVEKLENNPKRKNKELRCREFYEKLFPEIKRHREQTERFSRLGSRANWGLAARSEAEYNEILKDLTEKETHEKHMRDLAVEPPPLLDEDQRKVKFINCNGLIKDLRVYANERKMLNIWTEQEEQIFKEKYTESPKDFDYIARFLDNKNTKDCVLYYYRTKRGGKYKKLVRKQSLKRKRLPTPAGKDEIAKAKILKPRSEGDLSESDLEENVVYDEDSDGSEGSSTTRLLVSSSGSIMNSSKLTASQAANRQEPVETPRWSKNERQIAIDGLRRHGRNWTAISQMVMTKTDAQCKNFYFNYKKKLDLEAVVAQHNATKMHHRQESEETMSASEVSDDGFDITMDDKPPSMMKAKLTTRETRSQAAEKRGEPAPGPVLRSQRGSRASKPGEPKAGNGQMRANRDSLAGSPDLTGTEQVENQFSDEVRIVVDDLEDRAEHGRIDRDNVGSHKEAEKVGQVYPGVTVVPSSDPMMSTIAPSGVALRQTVQSPVPAISPPVLIREVPVTKVTGTRDHSPSLHPHAAGAVFTERPSTNSPVQLPSSSTSIPVIAVDPVKPTVPNISSASSVYPDVPYRAIVVDTPVHPPTTHTEALLDISRNMASSSASRTESKPAADTESEREKVKKISRFPDPQLPIVEQNEAIRTFSRFSPCIPPDTRGQLQVRTQTFPPSSFHPPNALVSLFGPHGAFIAPPEMCLPMAPGYPTHPQFLDYLQRPGLDPEHLSFSARLMEEAAVHQAHALWQHQYDMRGLHFGHLPPYLVTSEMSPRMTPPEGIARRRSEGIGHESSVSVPVTRCRSVETAVMYPKVRTPEHSPMSEQLRPAGIQQRSISLSDVHSMAKNIQDHEQRRSPFQTAPQTSKKEQLPDHVKGYEPFNALINVAAGAKPMKPAEEPGIRSSYVVESEKPQAHFTRQSCVVTNTSVIHEPTDSVRYGITTGRARKPPPLMPISGPKKAPSPDLRPVDLLFSMASKDLSNNPRELARTAEKLGTRSGHVHLSSPYGHSLDQQQQHPPPLVRSGGGGKPALGVAPDRRVVSPPAQFRSCGCHHSNEPCKHQLYSQEVPYVYRGEAVPKVMSSNREHDTRHLSSVPLVTSRESSVTSREPLVTRRETSVTSREPSVTSREPSGDPSSSRNSATPLFRPWVHEEKKDLPKTSKTTTPSPGLISAAPLERSSEGQPRYSVISSNSYPAQVTPGQVFPGQVHPRHAHPGPAHTVQAHPGQRHSGQTHSGQTQPGQINPGQTHPSERHPGQRHPGQTYPGERHPGERHPGQTYPGERHPGERHPGERHPGERHPGERHPGERHPGERHPGQTHPGQAHLGQIHAGQTHPGHVHPGQITPGKTHLGQARPGPTHLGQTSPGKAHLLQTHRGQRDHGQTHSGQRDPGQTHPGQTHSGQTHSGQRDPGQRDPGQAHSGQRDPGQTHPGQRHPGQAHLGQMNPGQVDPGKMHLGQTHPSQTHPRSAGQLPTGLVPPVQLSQPSEDRRQHRSKPLESSTVPAGKPIRFPYDTNRHVVDPSYSSLPPHPFFQLDMMLPEHVGNVLPCEFAQIAHMDPSMHFRHSAHPVPYAPRGIPQQPTSQPRDLPTSATGTHSSVLSRGYPQTALHEHSAEQLLLASNRSKDPRSFEVSDLSASDIVCIDEESSAGDRSSGDEVAGDSNAETLSCASGADGEPEAVGEVPPVPPGRFDPGKVTRRDVTQEHDTKRSAVLVQGTGVCQEAKKQLGEEDRLEACSAVSGYTSTHSGTTFLGLSDSSWDEYKSASESRRRTRGQHVTSSGDGESSSATDQTPDSEHVGRSRSEDIGRGRKGHLGTDEHLRSTKGDIGTRKTTDDTTEGDTTEDYDGPEEERTVGGVYGRVRVGGCHGMVGRSGDGDRTSGGDGDRTSGEVERSFGGRVVAGGGDEGMVSSVGDGAGTSNEREIDGDDRDDASEEDIDIMTDGGDVVTGTSEISGDETDDDEERDSDDKDYQVSCSDDELAVTRHNPESDGVETSDGGVRAMVDSTNDGEEGDSDSRFKDYLVSRSDDSEVMVARYAHSGMVRRQGGMMSSGTSEDGVVTSEGDRDVMGVKDGYQHGGGDEIVSGTDEVDSGGGGGVEGVSGTDEVSSGEVVVGVNTEGAEVVTRREGGRVRRERIENDGESENLVGSSKREDEMAMDGGEFGSACPSVPSDNPEDNEAVSYLKNSELDMWGELDQASSHGFHVDTTVMEYDRLLTEDRVTSSIDNDDDDGRLFGISADAIGENEAAMDCGTAADATSSNLGNETALDSEEPLVDSVGAQRDFEEPMVDSAGTQGDSEEPMVDSTSTRRNSEGPLVDSASTRVDVEEPIVDSAGTLGDSEEPLVDNASTRVDSEESLVDSAGTRGDNEGPTVDNVCTRRNSGEPMVDSTGTRWDNERLMVGSAGTRGDSEETLVDSAGTQDDVEESMVDSTGTQGDSDEPLVDSAGTQEDAEESMVDSAGTRGDSEEPLVDSAGTQGDAEELIMDSAGTQGDADESIVDSASTRGDSEEPMVDSAGTQGDSEEPIVDSADTQGDSEGPMVDSAGMRGDSDGIRSRSDTEPESSQTETSEAEKLEPTEEEPDSLEFSSSIFQDLVNTQVSEGVAERSNTSLQNIADTTDNPSTTTDSLGGSPNAGVDQEESDEEDVVSSAGPENQALRHTTDEDSSGFRFVSGSDDFQLRTISRSPSQLIDSSSSRENISENREDISTSISENREDISTSVSENRENISTSVSENREDISTSVSENREDISTSVSENREDISTSVSENPENISTSVSENHPSVSEQRDVSMNPDDVSTSVSEQRDDVSPCVSENPANVCGGVSENNDDDVSTSVSVNHDNVCISVSKQHNDVSTSVSENRADAVSENTHDVSTSISENREDDVCSSASRKPDDVTTSVSWQRDDVSPSVFESRDVTPTSVSENHADVCNSVSRTSDDVSTSISRNSDDVCTSIPMQQDDISPNVYENNNDVCTTSVSWQPDDVSTSASENRDDDVCTSISKQQDNVSTSVSENVATTRVSRQRDDVCTSVSQRRDDVSTSVSGKRDDVCTSVPQQQDDVAPSLSEQPNDVSTSGSEQRDDVCTVSQQRDDVSTSVSENRDDVCTDVSQNRGDVSTTENRTDADSCVSVDDVSPIVSQQGDDVSTSVSQQRDDVCSKYEHLVSTSVRLPDIDEHMDCEQHEVEVMEEDMPLIDPAGHPLPCDEPNEPTTTSPDNAPMLHRPSLDREPSEGLGSGGNVGSANVLLDGDNIEHDKIDRNMRGHIGITNEGTERDTSVHSSAKLGVSSTEVNSNFAKPVSRTFDNADEACLGRDSSDDMGSLEHRSTHEDISEQSLPEGLMTSAGVTAHDVKPVSSSDAVGVMLGRDSIDDTGSTEHPLGNVDNEDIDGQASGGVMTSPDGTAHDKYDVAVEAISSCDEDEDIRISDLEEGEIAETPGKHEGDDVMDTSDPTLHYIPISPAASTEDSQDAIFLDCERAYNMTTTEPTNPSEHVSRLSLSVPFPYSALNVRSTPNSTSSSPILFASGCSTPVTYNRAESNTPLSEHYEPLSDDENNEPNEDKPG